MGNIKEYIKDAFEPDVSKAYASHIAAIVDKLNMVLTDLENSISETDENGVTIHTYNIRFTYIRDLLTQCLNCPCPRPKIQQLVSCVLDNLIKQSCRETQSRAIEQENLATSVAHMQRLYPPMFRSSYRIDPAWLMDTTRS